MSQVEPDVRQAFAADAASRLDRMGEQLLELERAPAQKELLASLFRDAHSLKGAAAVIGLNHVSNVAHALEGPLQRMRSGEMKSDPRLTDAMLAVVDGLRALVANGGTAAGDGQQKVMAEALVQRLLAGSGPVNGAPAAAANKPDAGNNEMPLPGSASSPAATMQVAVERLDQIERLVGESATAHLRVGQLLSERLSADPATLAEYRELARLLRQLQEVAMRARMVPLSSITSSLHRAVRDLARQVGKDVRWEVEGAETEIDRHVLEKLHDPLLHLVRNAVDHGIEMPATRAAAGKPAQGVVRLAAAQRGPEIVISITDDGGGIDLERVRAVGLHEGYDTSRMSEAQLIDLIFKQGMSTAEKVTEISGRGVGLDVVRTNLNHLRGTVQVGTEPGHGSVFTVTVPITLMIVQCLVVQAGGHNLALPVHSILGLLPADTPEHRANGRPMILNGAVAIPVRGLAPTLGIADGNTGPVVIVAGESTQHAFRVDAIVGEQDLVVKGLGRLIARVDVVAGAAIEPDGGVVVVLDTDALVLRAGHATANQGTAAQTPAGGRTSILVVDDALTVRELERSILERAGYTVRTAADGRQALELLQQEPSDLVIADVEMPFVDGFALTESIRKQQRLKSIPIVILTSHDSEEDRNRGLAVGADAYIVKKGFDQRRLLSVVEQLLLGGRV